MVLADRLVEHGWLEVSGSAIVGAGEGRPPWAGSDADGDGIDARLRGRTIVPGFVDLHVHGGAGRRFEEGDREGAEQAVSLHRGHGTTSQLASISTGPSERMLAATASLAGLVEEGLLVGIHLEGPFLSHVRCGAQDPAGLRLPDPGLLAELLESGRGTVRMVTVAPELPGALALVEAIAAAGAVPAVGHTDATYEVARAAIERGARVATHLFNGMRPLHHREPGVIAAALEDERVVVELINDGHHLADATARIAQRLAGPRRCALVTDAIAAAGVGDGLYQLGERQVRVEGGRAMLADGSSLAGSALTMDRALRRAVQRVGMSLVDAVLAASTVPAGVLGLGHDRGSLAPGMRADLVVLDGALEVVGTMVGGAWAPTQPRGEAGAPGVSGVRATPGASGRSGGGASGPHAGEPT